MKEDLIDIFIGSDIETNYIASLLSDNGIEFIKENDLEQSISAGWVSGSTYNGSKIRVSYDDFNKARKIINEYLKDRQLH